MGMLKKIAGKIEGSLPGASRRRVKRRLRTYVGPAGTKRRAKRRRKG